MMFPPGLEIPDQLQNGLENLFHLREGCFDYYRHGSISELDGFRSGVASMIFASMNDKPGNSLYVLENENPDLGNFSDVKITHTIITPDDLMDVIRSDDFTTGWSVLVSTPPEAFSDDADFAKRTWLRVVQCRFLNQSPNKDAFGPAETFSISGDSNILVWTNRTLSDTKMQLAALDVGYVVAKDEVHFSTTD